MIFPNVLIYKIDVLRPRKAGRKLSTAFEILFKFLQVFQPGNSFKIQFLVTKNLPLKIKKLSDSRLKFLRNFQLGNSFKANNFKLQTVSEAKILSKYYCVFSTESACK